MPLITRLLPPPVRTPQYRIFYPGFSANESPLLADRTINPWLVNYCSAAPSG